MEIFIKVWIGDYITTCTHKDFLGRKYRVTEVRFGSPYQQVIRTEGEEGEIRWFLSANINQIV